MKANRINNQEGFTLVEIIAVLIILGILAAVAVPRYIDLESNAKQRAIEAAVSELNGRENLAWANVKIQPTPPADNDVLNNDVWSMATTDLGTDYEWTDSGGSAGNPTATQPTSWSYGASDEFYLKFQGGSPVRLTRKPAVTTAPATWNAPDLQ